MIVKVLQWSAWTPGVARRDEWAEFFRSGKRSTVQADPDVSGLPPLLRRRMSRLTRISMAVALDCCRQAAVPTTDVRVVFASRHGEMGVTVGLLRQLAAGDPLSPMNFSGSVHHTFLGYFSLATGNIRATRAVAGGEASFCYGFLDAMGLLSETPGGPVLLVSAEDAVPPPFASLIGKTHTPYAAALLLERFPHRSESAVSLEMPPGVLRTKSRTAPAKASAPPALDFLRWYMGKTREPLNWRLAERRWRWQK